MGVFCWGGFLGVFLGGLWGGGLVSGDRKQGLLGGGGEGGFFFILMCH